MDIDFVSLISFAFITTFTPGPNNISSAAMGVNFGYHQTLPYISGIFSGFFTVMCLVGLLSGKLTRIIPSLELILSIIGSLYILWLAWHTLHASYGLDKNEQKSESLQPFRFYNGFILQMVNPKAIIYAMTIYSTFLKTMERTFISLLLSGAALALLTFAATSTWTLAGTLISRFMNNPRIRLSVNLTLALLLLWTALKISGLLELLS